MKRCPKCQRLFGEDMLFCLEDGTPLEFDASSDPTVVIPRSQNNPSSDRASSDPTLVIPRASAQLTAPESAPPGRGSGTSILLFGVILLLSVAAVGFGVAYFMTANQKDDRVAVSNGVNGNQGDEKARQKSGLSGVAADPERTVDKIPEPQKPPPPAGPLPPSTSARTVDPPTNVRLTPNGKVQCVLKEKTEISILKVPAIPDNNGVWYRTTACGGSGLIHSSQITFN